MDQDLLAPLSLHFVFLNLLKADNDFSDEVISRFLRLAVRFDAILEHKVSEVTADNFMEKA